MKNRPTGTAENPHSLSKIVLILENSEPLGFLPEQIRYMHIHNIRHNKSFRSFDGGGQSVSSSFTVRDLKIVFRNLSPDFEEKLRALSNVAQLHIYYQSGRHHWYYVVWRDVSDDVCSNQYQEFYPDKNGDYVLKIKPPVRALPPRIAC